MHPHPSPMVYPRLVSMSTRISISTQSICCRVNMQAGTESTLPAAGVIDIIVGS